MLENILSYNRKCNICSWLAKKVSSFLVKIDLTKILLVAITIINLGLIILIISSLFLETSMIEISTVLKSINTWQAVKVTITSLFFSMLIAVIIGVPLAYFAIKRNNRFYKFFNLIINLPLIMPPAVVGLALLLTFGQRGILALNFAFTFMSLVIIQVFVILPFFTLALKDGFAAVDEKIEEAAKVDGASSKELLFSIYLPLSIKPFTTGLVIGCLRAAGEFGATIIFAGNLTGRTQTLATAVYTLAQQDGEQAIALALLLIIIFSLPLLLVEFKLKK